MSNPLLSVPLNTKMVYVKAVTPTGCDIYMPVDSFEDSIIKESKNELQTWLDETYPYIPPDQPPKTFA